MAIQLEPDEQHALEARCDQLLAEKQRLIEQLNAKDNELFTLRGALKIAADEVKILQAKNADLSKVLDSRPFHSDTALEQAAKQQKLIEKLHGKVVYLRDFIRANQMGVHAKAPPPKPEPAEPEETILEEAQRLTSGDRQGAYGHPYDTYKALAEVWTWYLKHRFDLRDDDYRLHLMQEDCCFMLSLLKVSREVTGKGGRDNLTDGSGYLRCVEMVKARRGVEGYKA